MNILLHPVGSHGDVHPFIGIGKALLARGHAVTLVTLDPFRSLAERNGLAFAATGSDEDYQRAMRDPDLWKPGKGLKVLFRNDYVGRLYRQAFDQLVRLNVPGQTVVAAGTLGFAARTAQEAHGIPLVTIHLQPATVFSLDRPAVYPGARIGRWPRWAKRGFFRLGDYIADRCIKPDLNRFRSAVGLPPVGRIIGRWTHSPQRVIGLFPDWYGSAPDWPSQMKQTGFIRYDQEERPIDPDLDRFLKDGDPPIVFSFGSAMMTGRPYFETAVATCGLLGKRGLILARSGDQIPPQLPPSIAHFDYAPFSRIFPLTAAVVHHGGIGTTAQCLAAGVPQLVVPLSFDQPDNADRIVRLGVGRSIPSRRFTPKRAVRALAELLDDAETATRCRDVRGLMTASDPLRETCRMIEEAVGVRASALPEVSSYK